MSRADHDVVIVGAGQGGLSVSYYLRQAGTEHTILDRGGVGHAWEANRWDSFCLVTPNWTVNLPGRPYDGDDPDGFMLRDDFVRYLKDWARDFGAPVEAGIEVRRVRREGDLFVLETSKGPRTARRVVIATATYQNPKIPPVSAEIPDDIKQLHAEAYKNPGQAANGAVLVVGSGQTGCQVVEDFLRAGREVYLCVARTGQLLRRYRGRDCISWQQDMGLLDRTPDMLDTPGQRFVGDPHLTGRDGGATVSLHDFHRRGVTLLGRLETVSGNTARFRDDLADNLKYADDFAEDFRRKIDAFIAEKGLDAPAPTARDLAGGADPKNGPIPSIPELNLKKAGIGTIIWATGFTYDFSWIDDLETDEFSYPLMERGGTSIPGLYFCGLNWMSKRKSGILFGVDEDAGVVAGFLADQPAASHSPLHSED